MTRLKLVPLEQLTKMGSICAWAGCPCTFKGDMPTGWTWFHLYWAKQPALDPLTCDWTRDAVLCPEHTLKVDSLMKRIPRVAE